MGQVGIIAYTVPYTNSVLYTYMEEYLTVNVICPCSGVIYVKFILLLTRCRPIGQLLFSSYGLKRIKLWKLSLFPSGSFESSTFSIGIYANLQMFMLQHRRPESSVFWFKRSLSLMRVCFLVLDFRVTFKDKQFEGCRSIH